MSSANGHYDQNLLAAAPKATKSQLQEGYNPDLLRETPRPVRTGDIESGHASKERLSAAPPSPPRVPFWRTTKGIIVIIVAVLVVIGAVVGGAVGGTRNKSNSKASTQGGGTQQTGNGNQGGNSSSADAGSQAASPTSSNGPLGVVGSLLPSSSSGNNRQQIEAALAQFAQSTPRMMQVS